MSNLTNQSNKTPKESPLIKILGLESFSATFKMCFIPSSYFRFARKFTKEVDLSKREKIIFYGYLTFGEATRVAMYVLTPYLIYHALTQ